MASLLKTGVVMQRLGLGILYPSRSTRYFKKSYPILGSSSRYKSGKSGGKGGSGGGAKTGGKSGGHQVSGRTVTVQPGRSKSNPVRSSDVSQAQRLGQGVHGKPVVQVPKHTTVPSNVKNAATEASVQIKRK